MANENSPAGGGYHFTMQSVTQQGLGKRDLSFTDESCFQGPPKTVKVNYIRVGGGSIDKIPIVHVDGVQMEHSSNRDTSTEYKAFCNSEGFNAMERSRVTLRSLHAVGNPKDLFTLERRAKLQHEVDALMRGTPSAIPVRKLATLAQSKDWYCKIRNPASVLEFDTRNMVVPCSDARNTERWVVRPHVALFNSSSMNNIDNEITQIGSELLTHFGDTDHARKLGENLVFLEQALHYEQGVASMLDMRDRILGGEHCSTLDNADWTKGTLFWSWLTDPICAVHIRSVLAAKETTGTITAQERTVLVQVEGLMNSLIGLFKAIVGTRMNSVIASMPAFVAQPPGAQHVTDYGYPTSFTLDEVDYCNLMYWIILPALGARVYRVRGDEHAVSDSRILYRAQDRNLTDELQLSNSTALTVRRLPGACVFSKVAVRSATDVSELFEPTEMKHAAFNDTGFSSASVVTYMWAIRLQKLAFIGNNLAKVLMGIHYSTLLTHSVIQDHYDTTYYSGMAYLLFRGMRFTGCGISLMQQKSALYTLGTRIVCKPTAHNTHQVHTANQYCESVVIPETLESLGVYIPNLYMKDVRGGDVHVDTDSPFDMVVADAFNGFCPESDSASGYRRPYIFTTGRSERLNSSITPDPLMRVEAYTCMPTLLHPFSSVLSGARKRSSGRRRNEESNLKLFCNTLHMVEFEKGVLEPIGDPFKDTADRVNGDKRTTDIMQPTLGVAFCGTCSIGLTADRKLMCVTDTTRETLVDRLAPRISGTGIFACNPIHTTTRLIDPIFNRIFKSTRYSRYLQC
ncbi:hypothetical protein ABVT39_017756 [Epinephelus coioides]